ncbi:hypothetical protein MGAS9429_Spy1678 [Streptococcus pyogenes MGAS9429]|uniref:Uncharacterized protein n=1 Tax=Streptococcus pyogenes serotype M12 (strain MGAS9429) TaxID=370551 RepID=Q1JJV8_STRPC|nr:hypothetical protein MGAS9429_Spy1678 [Streptococcus pyogenes MGAS9429]
MPLKAIKAGKVWMKYAKLFCFDPWIETVILMLTGS